MKGNARVFTVTCNDHSIASDKVFSGSGSGLNSPSQDHCINGNCSYSFDYLSEDLTDDSVINITCKMKLSSVITIVGVKNIAVTGYNNATVDCNDFGGLHFLSCTNVKIQNIIWKRCGFNNGTDLTGPVIKLNKSSTAVIQHCSFHNSVGPVVMLTNIPGNVTIDNCEFLNSTKYKGHGAVIYYYSSKNMISSTLNPKLSITNSSFKGNEGASSIIYIKSPKGNGIGYHFTSIKNSTLNFIDNTNVIFYLSNQNIHIYVCRNTIFKHYKEIFYGNNSNITIKNSTIHIFNSTTEGKLFSFILDSSSLTFKEQSILMFDYSDSIIALYNFSKLIFEDDSNVVFNGFKTSAIYSQNHSSITFAGSSKVTFSNNMASNGGAIIYIHKIMVA